MATNRQRSLVLSVVGVMILASASCELDDAEPRVPAPPATGGLEGHLCCHETLAYVCSTAELALACDGGFDVPACLQACDGDDPACRDRCRLQGDGESAGSRLCRRWPEDDDGCALERPDLCAGIPEGPCAMSADCHSRNCVDGTCFGRQVGSRCSADLGCNSGNCVDGCCWGSFAGQPCERDTDCDSLSCLEGTCQHNYPGALCDDDVDCDSNVCEGGRCL